MREISVHLRLTGSLAELTEHALKLNLSFFQCFLVTKSTGKLLVPASDEINQFLAARRQHFKNLYMHGSYWINLAGIKNNGHRALIRELRLAKKLEFNYLILHPGSATGATNKQEGIHALAKALNGLLKREKDIAIILENSAHGALSVGGDLHDFAQLLSLLDQPEQISFCIDTAHAYSYGYDLCDAGERDQFITLIETTIGINKVALLHLNDTTEKLASKIDKHATIGQGSIGEQALRAFVMDERLRHVPIIMELPVATHEQEVEALALVRSWH